MNARSLLIHTEAWVLEELAAQRRLLALLHDQEAAIRTGDTEALTECAQGVEGELRSGAPRDKKRTALIRAFASEWDLPESAMTLSSIAARLGADADRLVSLRLELRGVVASVIRQGRKIATIARHHQDLLGEIMQALAGATGATGADTEATEGALVRVEA